MRSLTRIFVLYLLLWLSQLAVASEPDAMPHRALLDAVLQGKYDRIGNDAHSRRAAFSLWVGAYTHDGSECRASASDYAKASNYFLQDYRERTNNSAAGAVKFEILETLQKVAKQDFSSPATNPAKQPDWNIAAEGSTYLYKVLNGCSDPRSHVLYTNFMKLFVDRARAAISGGSLEKRIEANRQVEIEQEKQRTLFELSIEEAEARGVNVAAVEPLVRVSPRYPSRLASSNVTGTARVRFTISTEGQVVDVSVLESTQGFERSFQRAVERWKFRPIIIDDEAYAIKGIVRTFSLEPPH